jgi:DNA repair protein RecO (recombination protein O)
VCLCHDVTGQFYRTRDDDLALLTRVQLNGALPALTRPDVYPYAHLLAELVDELTGEVHLGEKLYEYLASGLRGLNSYGDPEHVALLYAWRLLGVAGLPPRLDACARCGRDAELVAFDEAAGGLTCCDCRTGTALSPQAVADLQAAVGQPLARALQAPPLERTLQWRLLRRYVDYHVRTLRSFSTVADLRAGDPVPASHA